MGGTRGELKHSSTQELENGGCEILNEMLFFLISRLLESLSPRVPFASSAVCLLSAVLSLKLLDKSVFSPNVPPPCAIGVLPGRGKPNYV